MSDSASSGGTNILSLNSFCLYNIFRRIKINCERAHRVKDTLGKYLDLVNFALSCNILTKSFSEWNPELFEKLNMALDFSSRAPLINVNLSNLYKFMHNQSMNEQKLFWSAYLNGIRENDELESVKVTYKPAQYYPEHLDRFEALLNVLKEKNTLRELHIIIKGYSLWNVGIEGLQTLHVDARMDVNDLIQLLQKSPNLRRLKLTSAELSGRLSDIVPYCNQLEYLTISMKNDLDAAQYAPFAHLPLLKDLTLLGVPEEGSLLKLFQGLKETLIQHISIPNMIAVKVHHLNGFNAERRRLDRIRTEQCEVRMINLNHPDWTAVLDIFEKHDVSINVQIFTPLINLRNLTSLVISRISVSLRELFKNFASMKTHILEDLRVGFLSPEEVVEVAKIRSLKELECSFFCSRSLEHLATMNQLELLTINVHPQGRLRGLFKALASRQDQPLRCLSIERTRLTFEEVDDLANVKSLVILLLGLPDKQEWQHSLGYKPGSQYQYVRYCQKCKLPTRGSDHIEHSIHTKALPFLPYEAGFDIQVKFLTELYETSTPFNLNLLAKLPILRYLSTFGYSQKVVENLVRTLASEDPQKMRKITFGSQDFKLISQFEELQYLDTFFYHINDIDSFGLLSNLKELCLNNPHETDMYPILTKLKELPYLENLIVNGKDLNNYEIVEVVCIKTLKLLTVGIASNEWLKYLMLAKGLENLIITSTHYANENEVDYINYICMKCTKLKSFTLHRYYGYLTKKKVGELLETLKSVRDPPNYPNLLLRGIWVDFERLRQVYHYNETYLELESLTAVGYLSSDESEESDSDIDNTLE
ncbi:uncharacterized protein LOC110177498 [Drosophila serrata]|uniref:uncharacterized protein LOC110177498 n=1 Tax=Drosophila serrata TaxID=7274 RepID=UPI000A1CFCFC|nr:uncharacterized protein LOC110177498 [Drosophila serrata]